MPTGVSRRRLLKGLLAGGLLGVPAAQAPAPVAARPAVPAEPPRCTCRRTGIYWGWGGGAAEIVRNVLTYQCPACGKQVVEHG